MPKEVKYQLTPRGLLGQEKYDDLLLYMTKIGNNCIIWNGKDFIWGRVKYVSKVAKSNKKN